MDTKSKKGGKIRKYAYWVKEGCHFVNRLGVHYTSALLNPDVLQNASLQ